MNLASSWIRNHWCFELTGTQVKTVGSHDLIRLSPQESADLNEITIDWFVCGQNERSSVRRPFGERKWRRRDVHLAIPHENVAVTSESAETLVLVDVRNCPR